MPLGGAGGAREIAAAAAAAVYIKTYTEYVLVHSIAEGFCDVVVCISVSCLRERRTRVEGRESEANRILIDREIRYGFVTPFFCNA